jgi:biopolymer transport protein ExbB/TolQ
MDMIIQYLSNFGALDFLITALGVLVAAMAIWGGKHLSKGKAVRSRTIEESREGWMALQRIMTVVTDLFPLMGLLGTALAILNTFMNLSGPVDPSSVVANFAPGLTTTISGIFWALVNTSLLQLYFSPNFEKQFES